MGRGDGKQPSQRQLRVAEEIRHVLSNIIQKGELRDPELAGIPITVSEVRISADLKNATAFVLPLGGGESTVLVKAMGRAAPFIRRRISKELALKFVPVIKFVPDKSFDQAKRIEDVLMRATQNSAERDEV